jgi:hypothetical protein
MLNPLGRRNQSCIFDFGVSFFLNHFSAFGNETFHPFAFGSASGLLVAGQNLFQTPGVLFGLFQAFLKTCGEFLVSRAFAIFGKLL